MSQYTQSPIQIDQVSPNSPAQNAGLQAGDKIVSVDGHAFHTVSPLVDLHADRQGQAADPDDDRKGVTLPPIVVHPVRAGRRLAAWVPSGPAGRCAGSD